MLEKILDFFHTTTKKPLKHIQEPNLVLKSQKKITKNPRILWTLASMDLTQIQFHQHPKWELIESSPQRLIFKSPYINVAVAAIEIEVEGDAVFGLIKSTANPIGSKVLLGKGMPVELFLLLIVDVLAEGIFTYSCKD